MQDPVIAGKPGVLLENSEIAVVQDKDHHTNHDSIKGGFHQERTPRLVPVTKHACEPRSKHCKIRHQPGRR